MTFAVAKTKALPDGYWHARLSLYVGMPLVACFALLVLYATKDISLVFAAVFGGICGFFLDCDYDQRVVTVAEARIGNIPVIGWVWVGWSYGYSRFFNKKGSKYLKHRGLSHWPFLGTLTRVIWFWLPLFFAANFAVSALGGSKLEPPWAHLFVAYLALCIQDMIHLARDLWGWQL